MIGAEPGHDPPIDLRVRRVRDVEEPGALRVQPVFDSGREAGRVIMATPVKEKSGWKSWQPGLQISWQADQ